MSDLLTRLCRRILPKKRRWLRTREASYLGRHPGQPFLILATGPTVGAYMERIQAFIDGPVHPIVIVCNFGGRLRCGGYHLFANRRRFGTFGPTVPSERRLLLAETFPTWMIRGVIGSRPFERIPYNIEYLAEEGTMAVTDRGVIVSKGGTAVTIAMGAALAMGAQTIYCAGLDGFSIYPEDKIHFFDDPDAIQWSRRLMHERINWGILRDADAVLRKGGGRVVVVTPTIYTDYYDRSVLGLAETDTFPRV